MEDYENFIYDAVKPNATQTEIDTLGKAIFEYYGQAAFEDGGFFIDGSHTIRAKGNAAGYEIVFTRPIVSEKKPLKKWTLEEFANYCSSRRDCFDAPSCPLYDFCNKNGIMACAEPFAWDKSLEWGKSLKELDGWNLC